LAKHLYSIRFKPDLYGAFKKVAKTNGYTVTGAFEHFMNACVEANTLVFPDNRILDYEAEARILADWLNKGKTFYRTEDSTEVNILGRLIWLLPRVQDKALRDLIEKSLKKSVSLA
jgi:hypothetical protein